MRRLSHPAFRVIGGTAAAIDTRHSSSPVSDGELAAHKVPARGRYDEASRRERLAWLAERSGAKLDALDDMRLVADRLSRNVENAIGAVEVPVGIAGPLLFLGEAVQGYVHAPFATTEGALVASASRGATAISRSGGVTTRVLAQRMTRAPAFELASPREAFDFSEWIGERIDELQRRTREVSRHAVLKSIEPVIVGRVVHVLFTFETGDAAGQNMTTAATWHCCQWILEQLRATLITPSRFLIEANLSGDKKVNLQALTRGRGCAVVAECTVDGETLRRILKVSADDLLQANEIVRTGSDRVRMISHNINVANVIAAIFTATGQDIACVHESSLGELELRPAGDGVRARVTLPGLVVGTVGGGTHLPAQRALLGAMGCTATGGARRLAEIVGGFCLALELSTLSAVTTGEFASAHERLGRNRPHKPLAESDFGPAFFEPGLRRHFADPALRVSRIETIESGSGASILGELTARRLGKRIGLVHRRLHHSRGETDVVVKVKPIDAEVMLMMQGIAAMCGPRVAGLHARFRAETGFAGCHLRELAVYGQTDSRFVRHVPAVYDIVRDDTREAFVLVLERLRDVQLLDSADDPSGWGRAEIEAALQGIGAVHAIWMGRERELLSQPWIGLPPTADRMSAMQPFWCALAEHAADELPALMSREDLARQQKLVETIPEWWSRLESMPRTLVHNDFNPRNVALRDGPAGATLCAYDWELATVHLPQHDAAELLAFVLPTDVGADELTHYVELHRRAVEAAGASVPDARTWREGFSLAARDLLVNRFSLYLMAHAFRHYGFLERSLRTLRRLVDLDLESR